MTFLAPWAFVLGAMGAAGAVLLHLIARQRPAVYLLPTARFIPERETLVTRAAARPSDLLVLALRALLLLAAGTAFARPVLTSHRATRARIVLLDRSAAVADPSDAWRRTRALAADGAADVLIAFDSTAARIDLPSAADSSLRATAVAPPRIGSITAALVAARRAAGALALRADSVELVLVSPVAAQELDDATDSVRALWPGLIRVERVALRADSLGAPLLERGITLEDARGPSVARWPVRAAPTAIRLRSASRLDARDSSFAMAGGTVVMWDTAASPLTAQGLAYARHVIVATLGRRALHDSGSVVARWADGAAAATEQQLGAGCVRVVGIGLPASGDLALRPAFQAIVRGLLSPCRSFAPLTAADSATVARLAGAAPIATASLLQGGEETTWPLVPWLLGIALACALAELMIRHRAKPAEVA